MHHDRHATTEKSGFAASLVDELTIVADAQRLRSQYFGGLLRRLFGGSRPSSAASGNDRLAPGGGLRPQRS
jgi:hypothetical protein